MNIWAGLRGGGARLKRGLPVCWLWDWWGGAGTDAVAMRFAEEGCRYTSTFLHPRLARHRDRSPNLWRRRPTTDKVSQPFPGVRRRGDPGRHAFTFIGRITGVEAESELDEEMWGEEMEEEDVEMEEEEVAGEGLDDELEAPREDIDYLDRDSLLALMTSVN